MLPASRSCSKRGGLSRPGAFTERTKIINSLTGLVRGIDLGVEARKALTSAQIAFGYGIEVRPELRRRRYGRAIAAPAEQKCREMNVVSIGLTVFGPNKATQGLYEDMGFEVTALQMRKHLSTA